MDVEAKGEGLVQNYKTLQDMKNPESCTYKQCNPSSIEDMDKWNSRPRQGKRRTV
jgi:hypothetical protein